MNQEAPKCVPFISSSTDAQITKQCYHDCEIVRLNLLSFDNRHGTLPAGSRRWVDAGVDGLGQSHVNDDWLSGFASRFKHAEQVGEPAFQSKPDTATITAFTTAVLDACQEKSPDWISVPQLPYADGATRNRINRSFATAAGDWKHKSKTSAQLILPIILNHQRQANTKTARNPKVQLAVDCYDRAGADGYWVVDHTLNDVDGSPSFDKRFAGLVHLQEELSQAIKKKTRLRVVGPYWGLGLLLWARDLADYVGVGLGSRYRYTLPGGKQRRRSERVSLPGLYRWAVANIELREWLNASAAAMPQGPARLEFKNIARHIESYQVGDAGRRQIARFHRGWYDSIAKVPEAGRQLALYQQLSSGYVFGKTLDLLPIKEPGRRPESVARLLMMHCL